MERISDRFMGEPPDGFVLPAGSGHDMIKVRNLGKKSLDEVLLKLKQLNLHLRSSED